MCPNHFETKWILHGPFNCMQAGHTGHRAQMDLLSISVSILIAHLAVAASEVWQKAALWHTMTTSCQMCRIAAIK